MRYIIVFFLFSIHHTVHQHKRTTLVLYKKTSSDDPMRDGIKLYTTIFTPVNFTKAVPILIPRTPYGASCPPFLTIR